MPLFFVLKNKDERFSTKDNLINLLDAKLITSPVLNII